MHRKTVVGLSLVTLITLVTFSCMFLQVDFGLPLSIISSVTPNRESPLPTPEEDLIPDPEFKVSASTCHGTGRGRYCELMNVCWSHETGLTMFIDRPLNLESPLPYEPVLMGATDGVPLDKFFTPTVITVEDANKRWNVSSSGVVFHHRASAFVIQSLWPEHLTHCLSNSVYGLLSLMKNDDSDGERFLIAQHDGKPNTLVNYDFFLERPFAMKYLGMPLAHQPSIDTEHVHCFNRAVVGLRDTCPWNYCPTKPSYETHKHLRESLIQTHLGGESACQLSDQKVLIVQRKSDRKFTNLERITDVVSRAGLSYDVIEPGDFNLTQQGHMFCQTPLVIGMHGNALGNSVWMHPNTSLIEFLPYQFESSLIKESCELAQLFHRQIICKSLECAVPQEVAWGTAFDQVRRRSIVLTDEMVNEFEEALTAALQYVRQHHPRRIF